MVRNAQQTSDVSLEDLATTNDIVRDALALHELGGGAVYIDSLLDVNRRTAADADVIVETIDELRDAAGTGQNIWVPNSTQIDLAGNTLHFEDQWIGSGRGVDNADGGLLFSSEKGDDTHAWDEGSARGHLHLHGDSAMFGLRVRGDCLDWPAEAHPGYVEFPDGDREERELVYAANRGRAINVYDSAVTISNTEIWGWGSQGIHMGRRTSDAVDCFIHHCDIHDCMMTSAGYGVDIVRGVPVIEDTYFTATRHSLDTFGYWNSGWVARRCVFGPSHSSHILDAHGLHNNVSTDADFLDDPENPESKDWIRRASGNMLAEECTFLYTHVIPDATFDQGRPSWAASIRGVPWPNDGDGIRIRRCAFAHDGPQSQNFGPRSFSDPAAVNQQVHDDVPDELVGADGFTTNFSIEDNQYNIGLVPEYDGVHGAPLSIASPETTAPDEPADDEPEPEPDDPLDRQAVPTVGFTYGGLGNSGATYGSGIVESGAEDEPETETLTLVGRGASYGSRTSPPPNRTWLIGRSRVDGILGEHPTLTIGETATFDVVLTPRRLANHLGRYEQLRDRILYASETVLMGRTYDGRPWFTEQHNKESLVVKVQPGRDTNTGQRGVWGIIDGGDDATTLPETMAQLSVDIHVLAELRDYPNREAVIADLGR
jgi:hypothetical protein